MQETRRTIVIVAVAIIAAAMFVVLPCSAQPSARSALTTKTTRTTKANNTDTQDLSIALEYFQGRKFHEALVILARLDSTHRLNPRIRAYTGLCYYYEDDFAHAASILDEVIPRLKAFSPDERSLYYQADAASHFELHQYVEAAAAYDSLIAICHDRDKAEPYYRKGFIHIFNEEWLQALDSLQSSLVYYQQYMPHETARIAQIRNMIEGCCEKINYGL